MLSPHEQVELSPTRRYSAFPRTMKQVNNWMRDDMHSWVRDEVSDGSLCILFFNNVFFLV